MSIRTFFALPVLLVALGSGLLGASESSGSVFRPRAAARVARDEPFVGAWVSSSSSLRSLSGAGSSSVLVRRLVLFAGGNSTGSSVVAAVDRVLRRVCGTADSVLASPAAFRLGGILVRARQKQGERKRARCRYVTARTGKAARACCHRRDMSRVTSAYRTAAQALVRQDPGRAMNVERSKCWESGLKKP